MAVFGICVHYFPGVYVVYTPQNEDGVHVVVVVFVFVMQEMSEFNFCKACFFELQT